MIISPSHTLEYKPNDIIITSSIGYVLLHNPNIIQTIYVILSSLPGSTSKDLGGGASVLYLALWRLLTAPAPRNWPSRLPPRDCVPRPWRQSARVRAPLSRCVIARACGVPRTQHAYGLQRADIARVLSVALSYVTSSLVATLKNQRKPDSASPRSFAEQRYLYHARCVASSARPKSILNRVATVS